jgi:hypothetical protein
VIPAFPKLFHLGDPHVKDLFKGTVEITEKIDGSQFSFGKVNGEIRMRSKGAEVFFGDNNKMFDKAKAFVESVGGKLPENIVFHGEYLQSPRHNTLKYNREPKNNFMMFGASCLENSQIVNMLQGAGLVFWSDEFGCEVVPEIYFGRGDDISADKLREMLQRESALGGAQIEGFVIKNYERPMEYMGRFIPLTGAKFVSDQFKEKHVDGWKESNPSALEKIGQAFKATARWEKAIQHLRDDGKLENSPRDIGPLLKELKRDILEEEEKEIQELLFKLFKDDILRIATKGFPEYYKGKLLESVDEQQAA